MKFLLSLSLSIAISFALQAQKRKVIMTFTHNDVQVMVNEELVGPNPKVIKVDFTLGGEILFFKHGYYSQRIEIDNEKIFTSLRVNLEKKPKSAAVESKRLLCPDTLLISNFVTNMTHNDIREVIDQNFMSNNYFIGKSANLFPQAVNEITESRYKVAIEVVDTDQVQYIWKSPKFMRSYAKLRWTLLDTKTNKVVYYKETEGHYLVTMRTTKDVIISKVRRNVMEKAIEEAQFKLLTDNKFKELVLED